MKADNYKFDGSKTLDLSDLPTNAKKDNVDKASIVKKYEKNKEKISQQMEKLYASKKEGLVLVIQALDASGKDSLVKHVFTGMNPAWFHIASFKSPTSEELAHDYLWRIHKELPRRGELGIFNRSHYEDLVAVRVESYWKNYNMANRVMNVSEKNFFEPRYEQVRNYEEYLYQNSYRMIKIYLNVSKEEQTAQFLERIDDPTKNWKFSATDLGTASKYDEYIKTFSEVLNATGTPHSPWYAIPADQRWYTRYLVSEILLCELNKMNPSYPKLSREEQERLQESRVLLVGKQNDTSQEEKCDESDPA